MITYTIATSDKDLAGIMALQRSNLPVNLSPEEMAGQGFVTVVHSLDDLKKMNDIEQHVIAKDGDRVVAYLLAMTAASEKDIPVLIPMFEMFGKVPYKGKPVSGYHYIVVGQVCVGKEYRGQGILDRCYAGYRRRMQGRYDFAITEVSVRNTRSIRAHERIGFTLLHEYEAPDGEDWSIVVWEF
ncbi:MAG TPA: GNAT family N-acetyltransferase [Puia sp.]|nr:GNAT family N-acetyltransferase [Puia sp.]